MVASLSSFGDMLLALYKKTNKLLGNSWTKFVGTLELTTRIVSIVDLDWPTADMTLKRTYTSVFFALFMLTLSTDNEIEVSISPTLNIDNTGMV